MRGYPDEGLWCIRVGASRRGALEVYRCSSCTGCALIRAMCIDFSRECRVLGRCLRMHCPAHVSPFDKDVAKGGWIQHIGSSHHYVATDIMNFGKSDMGTLRLAQPLTPIRLCQYSSSPYIHLYI